MLSDEPILQLIQETNRVLDDGVGQGIQDNEPPAEMLAKLREDVFVFSGCKTYQQLREVSDLLLTDQGTVKPFREFYNQVQQIHQDYNVAYLETEYIFATTNGQMAAKWAEFEKDGDRYNLQYRTAGDDKVRVSHAELDGITLPVSDPFWDSCLPANGWRCRCNVVQVRAGKYPVDDSAGAIAKGEAATTHLDKNGNNTDEIFRFNPGKQRVIFPPKHPYRQVQDSVLQKVSSLQKEKK